MPPKAREVTDTELAILDVLWKHGPTAVREIVEWLYGRHTPSLHATVKSLLERLAQKGYVTCDTTRFAHRFSAAVDREVLASQQLQEIADSYFGGSLVPMLSALVNRVEFNRNDREAIRKIIEGIQPPPRESTS
jgi:BlaI family transcriptional regulator, penicillinase repressor